MRAHPFQHLDGAVDGGAFLVAGDQEAQRAVQRVLGQMLGDARDEGGDGTLHVAGAATIQHAVPHFAAERVFPPVGGPHWHDVGVAGEAEVPPAVSQAGVEVLDLPVP